MSDEPVLPRSPNAKHAATDRERTSLILVCIIILSREIKRNGGYDRYRAAASVYSQAQLNKVARQLNERPRKTLRFATPAERFNACVASTT